MREFHKLTTTHQKLFESPRKQKKIVSITHFTNYMKESMLWQIGVAMSKMDKGIKVILPPPRTEHSVTMTEGS